MLPVNKFTTMKFFTPSFNECMGSFFLIIMFCYAKHVYTDRFADMGIIVIRPPLLAEERIPCRAAARAQFLVINKGAGQFYGSLQSRYLFPELEATYSRKSPLRMHCNRSKCMQQEFEPKLPRDLLKKVIQRKKITAIGLNSNFSTSF